MSLLLYTYLNLSTTTLHTPKTVHASSVLPMCASALSVGTGAAESRYTPALPLTIFLSVYPAGPRFQIFDRTKYRTPSRYLVAARCRAENCVMNQDHSCGLSRLLFQPRHKGRAYRWTLCVDGNYVNFFSEFCSREICYIDTKKDCPLPSSWLFCCRLLWLSL